MGDKLLLAGSPSAHRHPHRHPSHPLPPPPFPCHLALPLTPPFSSLLDTIVIDLDGRRGRGRGAGKGRSGQEEEEEKINDGGGNIVRCLCDGDYPSRK